MIVEMLPVCFESYGWLDYVCFVSCFLEDIQFHSYSILIK